MKKKLVSALIVILVIGGVLVNHLISYANVANPPLKVNLTKIDLNGIGYGIADPTNGGEYIWNIMSYDSDGNAEQRNLYCVNADYGTTWFDGQTWSEDQAESQKIDYNLYYDIQNDEERTKLINFVSDSNDADEVIEKLLTSGENGIYEQLLYLFDNSYLREDGLTEEVISKKVEDYLINRLGIRKDVYTDEDTQITSTTYFYGTGEDAISGEMLPTESDIIAIQRMAVWYFTNGTDSQGDPTVFNQMEENAKTWLTITQNNQTAEDLEYNSLSTNTFRNGILMALYNNLITEAENADSKYTSNNNYDIYPAEVKVEGLPKKGEKYVLNATRKEANYLIGPITIEDKENLDFDIIVTVTDGQDRPLQNSQYAFTDSNGNVIPFEKQKELLENNGGFYVSVPRNTVETVNIKVDIKYDRIYKNLWLKGTEDANKNITSLETEQPLVEIVEDPKTITVELTSQPEEFDLALRKYITAVHDKNGDSKTIPNSRNLNNIDLGTLQTGTTSTYKHRKDPVIVEDGDIVTYTIRIYNEGTKAGYASKIIDQLPTGLINSTTNTSTVKSKDKAGNIKNTYSLTYNTTTNQIILTLVETENELAKSLESYKTGNLDYETIEIKCKVAKEADEKNQIILTNVAWIAEAYDAETNEKITTSEIGKDIDSAPGSAPNVNKDNMQNYKGNNSNNAELDNNQYFYQGQQDDDDFEKLVIMPVVKKFDLALFKHIAAISKDKIIEDGEYITDTGNKDGKYLRAPVVTAINPETGKITYQQDDKDALTVEPGDYVLYTIRVYNEGEVDGYAAKIKDALPKGLEFVEADEKAEYYGIWKLDGYDTDGREVVSTTWFGKGQGAEAKVKDANLLKALVKDGKITNENPDYLDAQVLCRVIEKATSDRVLVNYAQIAEDTDKDGNEIDDIDSTPNQWIDKDDDQDIERIRLQCFDLSLRKFITSVQGTELKKADGKYTREPVVDFSKLISKEQTTATYTHPKTPLAVRLGDKIVYTIRVYNEGDIDGYASEITDYLPKYLTFIKDSKINKDYGWQVSEDGRKVTTTYLKTEKLDAFNGEKLDYADVQIECLVSDVTPFNENQTNIAEITEYIYNNNVAEKDIDSTSDNMKDKIPADTELPKYKDDKITDSYVKGNEDDDDFEKIYVKEFDLALRKFITEVQEKEITTRVPEVKIENGTISYIHPKDVLTVHVGDVVIYTLRIYNEGEIDGYASEITDDIPEYLQFLPDEKLNADFKWKMYDKDGKETENVENAVKVKTNYLSKENAESNLIKAFDGQTLSYKEIKIAFEVINPNSNEYIITNHAQISNDTDKDGNEVIDKDSNPDVWNEGEDDQDIENIKVQYFDLSLLKFVSKVILIEDGKEKITETGYNGHENPEPVVKVELHKKKLKDVTVKFGYGITITNEGDIPGYATEITDYVPEGLKFDAKDNPNWTDEGKNVISTKQLENTLLQPGESKTVEVIFTWINGSDNLALKTNVAEISEDKNEYDVPDRDSTPDNKVEGEDDQDLAKVILAITTGTVKTYFTLTLGLLAVVLVGVVLIKKFVI